SCTKSFLPSSKSCFKLSFCSYALLYFISSWMAEIELSTFSFRTSAERPMCHAFLYCSRNLLLLLRFPLFRALQMSQYSLCINNPTPPIQPHLSMSGEICLILHDGSEPETDILHNTADNDNALISAVVSVSPHFGFVVPGLY